MIFKINDDFKIGILHICANILLGTPITLMLQFTIVLREKIKAI